MSRLGLWEMDCLDKTRVGQGLAGLTSRISMAPRMYIAAANVVPR